VNAGILRQDEDIAEIVEKSRKTHFGHLHRYRHAFSAGYDIGKDEGIQLLLDEILQYIGKENKVAASE
jgi:endonuclease IV